MLKKYKYEKLVGDIFYVSLGCAISAFAIASILKPNGLITGGITGASIILESLLHVKYTYIYYAMSISILLCAWILIGKKEAFKIIVLSLSFPMVLIFFSSFKFDFIENDTMLASIYYGILAGIGTGFILKRGFSQGSTDTIAKIIHRKIFPFISLGQILLGIDSVIIGISIFVYDLNVALYGILTKVVFMKSVDMILFGFGNKKVRIGIISDQHEKIAKYIMKAVGRGVSIHTIEGAYTKRCKKKLVSVCTPREALIIKTFIANIDERAFVDVIPVVSVWGNGEGIDNLIEEDE